jgi:hypothetical protein
MVKRIIDQVRRRFVGLNLPQTLLLSNIQPDQAHKQAVLSENAIERRWYKNTPRFENLAQILAAAGTGRLAKVDASANYLPIMRLRNPKVMESYPPYLTKPAKKLLDEIGTSWRQQAEKAGLDKNIRLAVTSLVRTVPYQDTIVAAGKLADPGSAHTTGEAFDIDASGYYLGETAINNRGNLQGLFQKAFIEMGADMPSAKFGDYSLYRPQAHHILKEVLIKLQAESKLHFVHEFPNTGNDVFHVCRNPHYLPR